jgi:hypothetical protein
MAHISHIEQSIFDALKELDAAVQQMAKVQPKPNLLPIFERIDALARQLPKGTNPDLLHYLAKKSYEKARLLLAGQDAENARGTCR